MKKILSLLSLILVLWLPQQGIAQIVVGSQEYDIDYLTPKTYEIGGITFSGAENYDTRMILLVAGLQVGDNIQVPVKFVESRQGLIQDILFAIDIFLLRQIANRNALRDNHIALRWLLNATNQFQERGFPRAIFANQTDTVFFANQKRNVGEKVFTCEVHTKVLNRNHILPI